MDNQQGNLLHIMDEYIPYVAYTLGALFGDGSVKSRVIPSRSDGSVDHMVRIACMDFDCIEIVTDQINRLFNSKYKVYSYKNPNDTEMIGLAINNTLIYNFFHYFIREKLFVPDEIFRASRKDRIEFLAGLFDTDGTISKSNSGYFRLGFSSRIRTFVEDTTRLLQKLGVRVGKIHEQISGYGTTIYVIKPNIRSFIDSGCYFRITRKASRILEYIVAMKPSETIIPNP